MSALGCQLASCELHSVLNMYANCNTFARVRQLSLPCVTTTLCLSRAVRLGQAGVAEGASRIPPKQRAWRGSNTRAFVADQLRSLLLPADCARGFFSISQARCQMAGAFCRPAPQRLAFSSRQGVASSLAGALGSALPAKPSEGQPCSALSPGPRLRPSPTSS